MSDGDGHPTASSLATAEAKDEVKGRLLLDVVVGQGAAVLELLAGEDETLLVRRDALLILDLRLDIVDGVRALDLESDGLARQGLDEDLHLLDSSTERSAMINEKHKGVFLRSID
ncbi:hypothetical protein PR202_ga02058 [Eleusine coracana subsp. coracana]|uniref:Uncharacterized protein n=1 Tax=Eleusine coracana subsp. coracana TaxID=191504 RepID=A0AAV5BIV5_ELECO|nr:hypothetical protein PR202_ga01371 [Eleusine coracana subsp. coracana]GJM86221.1 hypothetical protein PR202_ga02058 [Eleusine coracana subsp. coracana]